MKWFKHMAGMHKDEKCQILISRGGMVAYGRWIVLLELVAEQIPDNGERDFAKFDEAQLRGNLGYYHTKQLTRFLDILERLGLISRVCTEYVPGMSRESTGNVLTISIKNLIKIRDFRPKNKSKNKKENKKEVLVLEKTRWPAGPPQPLSRK